MRGECRCKADRRYGDIAQCVTAHFVHLTVAIVINKIADFFGSRLRIGIVWLVVEENQGLFEASQAGRCYITVRVGVTIGL